MIAHILGALQKGPHRYASLGAAGPQLDSVLQGLLSARKIECWNGYYRLPVVKEDEPLIAVPPKIHAYCPCGTGITRKDGRFCSHACAIKYRANYTGSKETKQCRKCRRIKNRNQFPARLRGYPKAVCYPCLKRRVS
jgi:hypothetical protein